MRTARRMAPALALAAMASIMLAGCGGGDKTDAASSQSEPPATEAKENARFDFSTKGMVVSDKKVTVSLPDGLKDAVGTKFADTITANSYTLTARKLDNNKICAVDVSIDYVNEDKFEEGRSFTETESSKSHLQIIKEAEVEFVTNTSETIDKYNSVFADNPFTYSKYDGPYWEDFSPWLTSSLSEKGIHIYDEEYSYDIDAETLAVEALGGPGPNPLRGDLMTGGEGRGYVEDEEQAQGEVWDTALIDDLDLSTVEEPKGYYVTNFKKVTILSECAKSELDDGAFVKQSVNFSVPVTEGTSSTKDEYTDSRVFSERFYPFTIFNYTVMADGTITVWDDNESFSTIEKSGEGRNQTFFERDSHGQWLSV